jgi:hypothetical protein
MEERNATAIFRSTYFLQNNKYQAKLYSTNWHRPPSVIRLDYRLAGKQRLFFQFYV